MYEPKFDISEVADLLGVERLTEGNSFNVVCPFCGDRRGKMNFRVLKDGNPCNTYRCFNCGSQGNMLTLYAEMQGIYGEDRYKRAYRKILEALGKSGYDTVSHRTYRPPVVYDRREQEKPDFEARSRVYEGLLELLTLTESHRRNLLNRGFGREQIEEFQFRSTPVSGTEGIARRLLKEGHSLRGIPGFFVNSRENWDAAFYGRNHGILCPVRSIGGHIIGFQIRLDSPYDGRKYLWFSSTNKPEGTGSRSPVGFFGDPYGKVVRVTEGILKASAAYAMSGYSFLGVPGVNQYKELEKSLAELKENGLQEVHEYYDMDKLMPVSCQGDYKEPVCEKCAGADWETGIYEDFLSCPHKRAKRDQIQEGCRKLYEICHRLDLRCIQKRWDCGPEGTWNGNYKGIDDYWWGHLKRRREQEMDDVFYREAAFGGGIPLWEKAGFGG